MCDGCKSCKDTKGSSCCDVNLTIDQKVLDMENKILLMGNPNVGKSVFFSSLTGTYVTSSNFAGTTVSYTKAKMNLEDTDYQLIDVPGTYSLSAVNEAEQVAVSFMEANPLAVICVLDATNLARNLNLALEIQKKGVPVIFALNLVDIATRKGIVIDKEKLSKELNAPVIETVAVKKTGFEELKTELINVLKQEKVEVQNDTLNTNEALWNRTLEISKNVTTKTNSEPNWIDKLGDKMIKPNPGIFISIAIILLSLVIIVFGGKALRGAVTYPLVQWVVGMLRDLVVSWNAPELLENILVGDYGILNIGIQWPIDFILPFVTMFYLVFTFLEDCGVLPRMAVLFDNIMRKMGVQGGALISLIMGYGCAVPAIIGTRNCTTKKERIIIATMVCFAVPCISQLGALISLFGDAGNIGITLGLLVAIFLFSLLMMFVIGKIVSKMLKGKIDPIVIEIPNLLIPEPKAYAKKLFVRLKNFLVEAEIPMLIAVGIIALVQGIGLLEIIENACSPVVSGMLGLPEEAAGSLLLGVIRKELSLVGLIGVGLTPLQLFVAGVVSLSYLPCIAVFGVLAKEFNARTAVGIVLGTFVTAILLGTVINWIGQLFILIF